MQDTKVWWQSLTVWGGIVSIIAPALGLFFHVTLGVEETNQIAVSLVGIATGIGGLMSIYGRIRSGQAPTSITLRRK
jgi:hypothetical protein